jgi:hypothetical protein
VKENVTTMVIVGRQPIMRSGDTNSVTIVLGFQHGGLVVRRRCSAKATTPSFGWGFMQRRELPVFHTDEPGRGVGWLLICFWALLSLDN